MEVFPSPKFQSQVVPVPVPVLKSRKFTSTFAQTILGVASKLTIGLVDALIPCSTLTVSVHPPKVVTTNCIL